MSARKNEFIDHLTFCLKKELDERLDEHPSSIKMLTNAQWIIDNYIDHIVQSMNNFQSAS